MKKTFVAGLVLLGMSSLPVSAGEVGLLVDKQVGAAQILAAGNSLNATPGSYAAVSPTGAGVRLGYTLLNLEVLELGVIATYHPSVQGNLKLGGVQLGTYSNQYEALGIQADWTFLLNIHAGVEMRSEKVTANFTSPVVVSASETLTRPWVNAGLGLSLPLPILKPFVRLEVAAPMQKTTNPLSSTDFVKAMAPSLQVSLYGGIRF